MEKLTSGIFLLKTAKESGVQVKSYSGHTIPQSVFICSKLTIETLEQEVKYVQS